MPDTNPENYAVINIINGWIDLCGATKESLATFFKRSSCLEKIALCFYFIILFILLVFLISIYAKEGIKQKSDAIMKPIPGLLTDF